MARHYQSEPFGLSVQLSSRNCNTGYRQAIICCRNLLCYQGTLFAVFAVSEYLTLFPVRSCTQSTAPGITHPSNGFKLPSSSTRFGECAAIWLWSESPRGKRPRQDSTQYRSKLVIHRGSYTVRSTAACGAEFVYLIAIHSAGLWSSK